MPSIAHAGFRREPTSCFTSAPSASSSAKFLDLLDDAQSQSQLQFRGRTQTAGTPDGWNSLHGSLKRKKWVVYAKRPFGSPETVLEYLGRYTHRVAISNHRIQSVADGKVTFLYRGRKGDTSRPSMTLDAGEFIRRFLPHVLPAGFQRVGNLWTSPPNTTMIYIYTH